MHAQHLHALLVEDDDAYATMLQAELTTESSARVSIERARSLSDAIARFAARSFDANLVARSLRYACERTRLRRSLIEREARFRALVEQSHEAITLLDERRVAI